MNEFRCLLFFKVAPLIVPKVISFGLCNTISSQFIGFKKYYVFLLLLVVKFPFFSRCFEIQLSNNALAGSFLDNLQLSKYGFFGILGKDNPNQKLIGFLVDNSKVIGVLKIPVRENANMAIEHELDILKYIEDSSVLNRIKAPIVNAKKIGKDIYYVQEYLEGRYELSSNYIDVGDYLQLMESRNCVSAHDFYNACLEKIPYDSIEILNHNLISSLFVEKGVSLNVGLSHGDFAPWNMKNKGGSIVVFDWEYSSLNNPIILDLFHYIVSQFENKRNGVKALLIILESSDFKKQASRFVLGEYNAVDILKIYIIYMIGCKYKQFGENLIDSSYVKYLICLACELRNYE